MPIEIDRVRDRSGGDFRNCAAFPVNDLTQGLHALLVCCRGVTDLTILKKNPPFFAARTGQLDGGGRAAHALQLNNIGHVQIAQRALEFFTLTLA